MNHRHPTTTLCTMGAYWKRQRLVEEEAREGSDIAFKEYDQPLAMVYSFRYLKQTLMATYNNCPVVVGNMGNASQIQAIL